MTLELYLAYVSACFMIALVPGPTLLGRTLVSRVSGACLAGGGLWLALTRTR